jgi:Animal haem peroxidase/Cellulose binding domain
MTHRPWLRRFRLPLAATAALATAGAVFAVIPSASAAVPFAVESLDGGGNNVNNPAFGQSNRPYARVGTAHYADGIGSPQTGPNARAASNRIIQDTHQNVFSERRVSQWGWTWGQFLDHTFGLRAGDGPTATAFNIPFQAGDPMEDFSSNLGVIAVNRSAQSAGTGTSTANPRQQTNTLPSYIGGNPVYGATNARLDWLRDGSLDGNPANNQATLMLPNGYLPRKTARGNPAAAPAMDVDGRLLANPNSAAVAGDARANENIALTATHTLFAREHNRIVGLLPNTLSQEDRFQIARRVVIAEEQYITYQEFLPAMGVALPRYTGYKNNINTALSNEFATVGYRAHSQIHGEFELEVDQGTYTAAQLAAFEAQGLEVENPSPENPAEVAIAIPLNVAFFNPDLLQALGADHMLQAIGAESQYNNDENIDDALRSVLFQVPVAGNTDCLDGPTQPECFTGVNDLGAIDIQRARDHGIGTYNQLRAAYGLPAQTSFTAITGEATDTFPPGLNADTPASLEVASLADIDGTPIDLNDEDAVANTATRDVRRTTTAARLRAVYGNTNSIDAFTGMIAEKHVPGAEFGELQLAIWTREFQRLRDGDRFFYGNDQGLSYIQSTYGIDYRHTLRDVILANTDVEADELNPNVFLNADANLPATSCTVNFNVTTSWPGNYQVDMKITNTGTTAMNGWTMRFEFANGQSITQLWNGVVSQTGPNGRNVAVANASWNAVIPAGGSLGGVGFNALADDFANAKPPNISVNNRRCAVPLP